MNATSVAIAVRSKAAKVAKSTACGAFFAPHPKKKKAFASSLVRTSGAFRQHCSSFQRLSYKQLILHANRLFAAHTNESIEGDRD